jgi:signal transduction histidine kinase
MNINESIFAKILVLIVLYGILINVAVVLFLNVNQNPEPIYQNKKILAQMEENLADELGIPPDTALARKFFEDYNVNIRFKYNDINWASSDAIASVEDISNYEEYKANEKDTNYFSFFYKDKIYGVSKITDGIIIISYYYNPNEVIDSGQVILAIIIHLVLFFVPLYFLIKWLLNPLNYLADAVKQIGNGNFDVELAINRYDEFGVLANSLKNMSSRIKDTIKAKEQLLMDISHELRTPLTRIKFGLELGMPKEKINEDVVEIENMIKRTLDYYRNEFYFLEANLSDTNVIPLLENVISSFDIQQIRIGFYNFARNKNRIIIQADEEKLTIAFRNLISNALKYSPADKNILVSIDETEKFYKIGVRDFGIGMKKEDMRKIFEPFSRIDSSRSKKTGGYGLGLAIVKKIIDLHNAFIEVKSGENEGTEMIVGFRK